jgi:hypothetical protein
VVSLTILSPILRILGLKHLLGSGGHGDLEGVFP